MKKIFLILIILCSNKIIAQELFVFTEPASNMAAKSIGIRMNNYLMKNDATNKYNYHLLPEIMVGISKSIMVHGQFFFSNRNNSMVYEGASIYTKYRFYSVDDVHSHFRMAAFGRLSFNNSDIHQAAIDFNGHNTGVEAGMVATQLINKVAISASAAVVQAYDNGSEKFQYPSSNRNAINYTLSAGKLMLPKLYTSYKQVNMNLMCEFLGQTNLGTGKSFVDIAPSAQFIIDSRMRLDLAYRLPLVNNLSRTTSKGFVFKLEYNFFNAF